MDAPGGLSCSSIRPVRFFGRLPARPNLENIASRRNWKRDLAKVYHDNAIQNLDFWLSIGGRSEILADEFDRSSDSPRGTRDWAISGSKSSALASSGEHVPPPRRRAAGR